MLCNKCKMEMKIKRITSNTQIYVCRNRKCTECGKEIKKVIPSNNASIT